MQDRDRYREMGDVRGARMAAGSRRMEYQRPENRRKKAFSTTFLWVWAIVSGLLLLYAWKQIGKLDQSLNLMLNRLTLLEEQYEYQNQEYQAAPTSAVPMTMTADYADMWGLGSVERPKERTYEEVLKRLEELSVDSELIAQVSENSSAYPRQLLEALANNPEMADFAANFLEKKGTVTGQGLTDSEKVQDFPLFLQWDPRWGYASYGDDSVVGLSGCGPTALSMALYYLTGDETITPDYLADYSMRNGYYISGTGTAWLLMEKVPLMYGISVSQPDPSEQLMKQALDQGCQIICSVSAGDFTVGGHFVVIYGYDSEGFLINDPNCVARSRISWTFAELKNQIKHIWVLGEGGTGGVVVYPQVTTYEFRDAE